GFRADLAHDAGAARGAQRAGPRLDGPQPLRPPAARRAPPIHYHASPHGLSWRSRTGGREMSEARAEQPTGPAEAAPQEAPAQEVDWKAEARKWEDRAKKNSDAAQRLAEIEEASKTAEQKAAERLAELEQKVNEYETREQVA